jgi:SAM-dependent methyltransferase
MRRDWNERARRNAFFYIASWRGDWKEESFFESGEADYLRLVEPVLEELGFAPDGKTVAELGCGAGRMTRAFARRFGSVVALDISEEMQARAKNYLGDFQNIRWVLTDGATLGGLKTGSVDFVFSYLVLQHYPTAELVAGSIREMVRVLRPGGVFLFQFNGSPRPTMNWRGRTLCSVLDGLSSAGLLGLARGLAKMSRIDPETVGATWRGVTLASEEVERIVRDAGGVPSGFYGTNTPIAWCFGRRAAQETA